MKAPQIELSTEYDKFVHHDYQQKMSARHVADIVASMRTHGYFESEPIGVYREGDKLVIIDGHHRLAACKELGLPVRYVVEPTRNADTIGDRNAKTRKWTSKSFISMYAAQGNENYVTLQRFIDMGFTMVNAAALLRGWIVQNTCTAKQIQAGTFVVKTTEKITKIAEFWDRTGANGRVRDVAPEIMKQAYVEALTMCLLVPEFDIQTLGHRVLGNARRVVRASTRDEALEVLDEIYNYRCVVKLQLAFLAKQATQARSGAVQAEQRSLSKAK